ncbi:MAG TPA: hypothetical protein VFA33_19305 [Bryobacteraceae bacterium]|nr:hypothetical protein [Bryobacteraceae bacterium]
MTRTWTILAGWLGAGLAVFAQAPTIQSGGIQDAASYTANIAQGSIFVVKGSNLSAPGFTQATLPLGTTLGGSGITFTPAAGGAAVNAYMVYTYNQSGVNQLAGILPSTAAPGTYNVTVSYNGTSAPVQATVVARKYGSITANGSGTGRAVVQIYISQTQLDINRFTTGTVGGFTMSPAHPGQTLIAWGTGLGAIQKADNDAPGAIDLRSQVDVKVIVGNSQITPGYAGRSPSLPGADQINFQLPSDVQTGCNVPLQVSVGGQLSNLATISIAPAGADACVSPMFSKTALARLDQGLSGAAGNIVMSSLASTMNVPGFGSVNAKTEGVSGSFFKFSADQLGDASGYLSAFGACQVYRRTGTQNTLLFGISATGLDAGAALTLTGPSGLNKQVPRGAGNLYSLSLGTSMSGLPSGIPGLPGSSGPVIVQGSYQLVGPGGADVGPFQASLTVNAPLTLTNPLPDTVVRSQNLALSWSGGGNDLVAIIGASGTMTGGDTNNPIYDAGVFVCTTTADKLAFTVPSSVLSQLPATPAATTGIGGGFGMLMVTSTTQTSGGNGVFSAPLTAGGTIDNGLFTSSMGTMKTTSYQ